MRRQIVFPAVAALFVTISFAAASFAQHSAVTLPWSTHAHDAQHTGISGFAGQSLHRIRWTTKVDLHPVLQFGELLIHYGSPLVTENNTVIVPVKTGDNSFKVEALKGTDGSVLWTQHTDYQVPGAGFTPSFGPVLSKHRLIMPAAGGTVLVR